jgi:hypothetical protein
MFAALVAVLKRLLLAAFDRIPEGVPPQGRGRRPPSLTANCAAKPMPR